MAPILRIELTFLMKSREEKNQNPQKETGKSGLLIAKEHIYVIE